MGWGVLTGVLKMIDVLIEIGQGEISPGKLGGDAWRGVCGRDAGANSVPDEEEGALFKHNWGRQERVPVKFSSFKI